MESREVGEPGKGQDLSATVKEQREEKERHCRNRKSQAPFGQSCQSISVRSIASIPRRMGQKAISTLRSALIAGPSRLFVPFEAIFENDALPEKWKHYAQTITRKRANRAFSNPLRRALAEPIEEQLKEKGKGEAMNTAEYTTEDLVNQEYKYGFVTDIETDTVPRGLNEQIVRLISAKKNEPDFMLEWRLKAYHHWAKLEQSEAEPKWANVHYPPINYQDRIYYSAPKTKAEGPKSLDEVDPSCSRPMRS